MMLISLAPVIRSRDITTILPGFVEIFTQWLGKSFLIYCLDLPEE